MRKILQCSLFFIAMAASVPMPAATATDFYTDLLRRGAADVEAGRHDAAVTPLRIAAFGLVDSIEHYQTAQAYLVVAFDRLNQPEAAREAANRILAAERVERKFASLRLPETIRTSFTAAARKFLPATEVASLTAPPAAPRNPAATTQPPQPQTSSKVPQGDTPKKPVVEEPKKPVEKPATTQPVTTTTTPAKPAVTPPAPKPAPVQTQPAKPVVDVPARLAAGERALVAANLAEARRIYRELLDAGGHDHATWIRVAEGLYRSRDFTGALAAFQRVGTLRPGEEAYRYYIAVAYYENGQYESARRELAAALPFIEITPDVQRYRARIEGAR